MSCLGTSRTRTTLAGLDGMAITGSTLSRLISSWWSYRTAVCCLDHPVRSPPDAGQELPRAPVRREHRRGRAQLGTHIRDDMMVRCREARKAGTAVNDDAAEPALDAMSAEHLRDDVLGADPVLPRPCQVDAPGLRHDEVEGSSDHREDYAEAAGAEREHSQAASSRGMAVTAYEAVAALAEALHMGRVADAGARPAAPDAKPPADKLKEQIFLCIQVVGFHWVVVDILGYDTDRHAVNIHRLEFQHHECAQHVFKERLISAQLDFAA